VDVLTGALSSVIALLLGALFSKISSDKKLDRLATDLKGPLEDMSRSVIELDRKVVQLIEKYTSHTDDIDEIKRQIEEIFNRMREVETRIQLHSQRIDDIIEKCRGKHGQG
jgi:chromosome segregation ATPase